MRSCLAAAAHGAAARLLHLPGPGSAHAGAGSWGGAQGQVAWAAAGQTDAKRIKILSASEVQQAAQCQQQHRPHTSGYGSGTRAAPTGWRGPAASWPKCRAAAGTPRPLPAPLQPQRGAQRARGQKPAAGYDKQDRYESQCFRRSVLWGGTLRRVSPQGRDAACLKLFCKRHAASPAL